MEILSCEEHADVLGWISHGKGFIIYKKKKFSSEVLPKYFKQSKFTSFTRKLNRWGFSRVTRGPETGSYYHKLFLRDQPDLCLQMSCQNTRQTNNSLSLRQHQRQQEQLNLTSNNNNIMPFGIGVPGTANQMNPNALMQMQLQLQQQQLHNELLRRAMASQATAHATQAQLLGDIAAGTISTNGNNNSNNNANTNLLSTGTSTEEMLYMQMVAQSKASSMSAQPLMQAIQNSLLQNHPSGNVGMMGGSTAPSGIVGAISDPNNINIINNNNNNSSGLDRVVSRAYATWQEEVEDVEAV